jgi:hypothetical protein
MGAEGRSQYVDQPERLRLVALRRAQYAGIDAVTVLDVDLDRVEHHGVEDHAGDLRDGRRLVGAARRAGWRRAADADRDDPIGAQVDCRAERGGVADRAVAVVVAVDLNGGKEDRDRDGWIRRHALELGSGGEEALLDEPRQHPDLVGAASAAAGEDERGPWSIRHVGPLCTSRRGTALHGPQGTAGARVPRGAAAQACHGLPR